MELNDTVKVTLTKEGAEWLRGQKGDNKEGDIIILTFGLLIRIFSSQIGWGKPVPFTNIEIVNE